MSRPEPPERLLKLDPIYDSVDFEPSKELENWIWDTFIDSNSPLHNPDHDHLTYFGSRFFKVLWASSAFIKAGQVVLGQTERVMFRAGGWQKMRQESQMINWFGYIPEYVITIDARYASECSDIDFCALIEHELYHIGVKRTDEGEMILSPITGMPKHYLRGHDVEEFHGVVGRYGANDAVQHMVDLANAGPTISKAKIAHTCGTCLLKLA